MSGTPPTKPLDDWSPDTDLDGTFAEARTGTHDEPST